MSDLISSDNSASPRGRLRKNFTKFLRKNTRATTVLAVLGVLVLGSLFYAMSSANRNNALQNSPEDELAFTDVDCYSNLAVEPEDACVPEEGITPSPEAVSTCEYELPQAVQENCPEQATLGESTANFKYRY
jgi:hypothetical protein